VKTLHVFDFIQITNKNISHFRITLFFGAYPTLNKMTALMPWLCRRDVVGTCQFYYNFFTCITDSGNLNVFNTAPVTHKSEERVVSG
jgi:hypothetical protein